MSDAAQRARGWLTTARNPDGSWGYFVGRAGSAEPTLLAVAAGFDPPHAWLARDLSWGALLAPCVLAGLDGCAELVDANVATILGWDTTTHAMANDVIGHDLSLLGWSWIPGTSGWVEPTAFALLSLRRVGRSGEGRYAQGAAMLADRRCSDGGWNLGNPKVYSTDLPSDPTPTAWAAMARGRDAVDDRLAARLAAAATVPSTTVLATTLLACVATGVAPGPADALVARQDADGSFGGRVERTALAVLALDALERGTHVFAT
jgi:hypothetical protein